MVSNAKLRPSREQVSRCSVALASLPSPWRRFQSSGRSQQGRVVAPAVPVSVRDDGADRLARVHEIEGVVDALVGEGMGYQLVDSDLALHVPVDDLGHVSAAARAAECGAFPDAARDELE